MAVFGVTALFLYGWTTYWFLWKLPSWLYYLRISEIFSIAFYSLSVNLVECLVFLVASLGLSLLLPRRWFRDFFVPAGSLLNIFLCVFLVYFTNLMSVLDAFSYTAVVQAASAVVLAPILAILLSRPRFISSFIIGLADRTKVFLYFLIPASIGSLFIVVFKILF
jgi:hypothetical protein